jgi:excisionase family DNA binding protein
VPILIDAVYAAWILGVTDQTIKNYIKSGKLKASKIGGEWRINKDKLRAWIEEQEFSLAKGV